MQHALNGCGYNAIVSHCHDRNTINTTVTIIVIRYDDGDSGINVFVLALTYRICPCPHGHIL